jgi:hypothetical protein
MQYKRLVRDKLKSHGVVGTRTEYKTLAVNTLKGKIDALAKLDMKSKDEVYNLLSDIMELTNCLANQYLVTKSELSSVSRHSAYHRVNKKKAEDEGGYFNGQYEEVDLLDG